MALKMITVSLREHTVAVAFTLVPLALINILIRVDHATFPLGQAIHPVAIVSVPVLIEEGSPAMLLVFVPVTRVLSAQLSTLIFPVSALAMALIDGPHALILVSILVELDAKAFLAVIAPITDILLTGLPLLPLDSPILLLVLLLDPVDGSMSAILLSFRIITTEKKQNKTSEHLSELV